jgi:hypothetical protein
VLAVVPLSLLAAFLFAAAAAFQQRAAHAHTAAARDHAAISGLPTAERPWLPVLSILTRLLRDRLWLLGWLTNLVGFLVQAVALHLGSIAIVQPLLVAQLLFALPLSIGSSRGLPRRDWFGGAAIAGGLVVLLTVRGAAPQSATPTRYHVLLATAAAATLVTLLVAVARTMHDQPQLHAALVAVAAGLCFCMSAVFITLTAASLVERGVAATAVDWPGYALAGSTVLGLLLEQDAFAAGSLPTAVAAMTITNPVASYLVAVLAFASTPPETPGALAGLASAGLLVVVGVIALAQSPTLHDENPQAWLVDRERGTGAPGSAEPAGQPAVGGRRQPPNSGRDAEPAGHDDVVAVPGQRRHDCPADPSWVDRPRDAARVRAAAPAEERCCDGARADNGDADAGTGDLQP